MKKAPGLIQTKLLWYQLEVSITDNRTIFHYLSQQKRKKLFLVYMRSNKIKTKEKKVEHIVKVSQYLQIYMQAQSEYQTPKYQKNFKTKLRIVS